MKTKQKRFLEIDLVKGIAVILMIAFHFAFDLAYFANQNIDLGLTNIWWFIGRSAAILFLLVVGINLTISKENAFTKKQNILKKFLKKGLKIFGLGLLITLVTYILFPQEFILFGILHLIGLSIILSIPFLKFEKLNLILGSALIIIGIALQTMKFNFSFLLWLGLIPQNFASFDYFPLMPWFGLILIGIFIGNTCYKNKKNSLIKKENALTKTFCFLGKNSLVIYLIHQPLLIALLYLRGLA